MNFTIENAQTQDRDEIIKVLTPWNMHHIPSSEADEIDYLCFFVAKVNRKIVGLSGYKILSDEKGKTTFLAVYPEFQGTGIGKALQEKRLEAMYSLGIKKVTTNADRPDIILWYKKHFGYRVVGKLEKLISFGEKTIGSWTTLEMNLVDYMSEKDISEKRKLHYIDNHDPHPLSPYPPLIINVALTGMVPTKMVTPHVSVSIYEIIEDAIRVYNTGASIVHLYARDENGHPVSSARYCEDIITSIKKILGLYCDDN